MNLGKITFTGALLLTLVGVAPRSFAVDNTSSSDNKAATSSTDSAKPKRRNANQFKTLAEQLKLNDEQEKKLKPIYEAQAAKLRTARQDTSLSNKERRDKVREIREEYNPQIKDILTAEQFAHYQKLQQGNGAPRRAASAPPAANNNSDQNSAK